MPRPRRRSAPRAGGEHGPTSGTSAGDGAAAATSRSVLVTVRAPVTAWMHAWTKAASGSRAGRSVAPTVTVAAGRAQSGSSEATPKGPLARVRWTSTSIGVLGAEGHRLAVAVIEAGDRAAGAGARGPAAWRTSAARSRSALADEHVDVAERTQARVVIEAVGGAGALEEAVLDAGLVEDPVHLEVVALDQQAPGLRARPRPPPPPARCRRRRRARRRRGPGRGGPPGARRRHGPAPPARSSRVISSGLGGQGAEAVAGRHPHHGVDGGHGCSSIRPRRTELVDRRCRRRRCLGDDGLARPRRWPRAVRGSSSTSHTTAAWPPSSSGWSWSGPSRTGPREVERHRTLGFRA